MTAEYLDRSSLVARMKYYEEHTTEESGEHYAYSVALREIRNAPAADVAPVVHGQWASEAKGGVYGPVCSVCGYYIPGIRAWNAPYCPKCGARMDGTTERSKNE